MKIKVIIILYMTILSLSCKKNIEPSSENSCQDVVCQNNGVCIDGNCDCTEGFTGQFCDQEVDPCLNIECQNNGVCLDGNCNCAPNYSGTFCQTLNPPDSISIYRVEFDYWRYNNQTNYNIIVGIEYYINNNLNYNFDNIYIDASTSDYSEDFINPIGIPLPKDKLMTFSIVGGYGYYGTMTHNVLLDGNLEFEVEDVNNGIYKLHIFNSDGSTGTSNGEFSFWMFCKLHYN